MLLLFQLVNFTIYFIYTIKQGRFKRMNNLLDLAGAAMELDSKMTDVVGIAAKELMFEDGHLVFADGKTDYQVKPTKHGMKTLLDQLEINVEGGRGKIAELFNNNLTAPAAAQMLNSMLASYNNGERRMHLRLQGDNFVAAFKPETELVTRMDIIQPFITNVAVRNMAERARIIKADLVEKIDLRVMLDEYTGLEHHGAGIELIHPMINATRTQINPLVKTTSCDNSLVSSAGFALNNGRGFVTRFNQNMRLVQGLVQSSIETVKQLEGLYEVKYDFKRFLDFMKNDKGINLTDPMIETLVVGSRNRSDTLYGQVNGLTYLAHKFEDMKFDMRYNLEKIAGSIVDNPTALLETNG